MSVVLVIEMIEASHVRWGEAPVRHIHGPWDGLIHTTPNVTPGGLMNRTIWDAKSP